MEARLLEYNLEEHIRTQEPSSLLTGVLWTSSIMTFSHVLCHHKNTAQIKESSSKKAGDSSQAWWHMGY